MENRSEFAPYGMSYGEQFRAAMRALYPHELLRYFAVPRYRGAYVLGCFAKHVTLYSQQVRAINLIDALCRTGELGRNAQVVVVGGGVAGLTAAAAAMVRGARVTLLEQSAELCPIQSAAGERYLHPRIYDWPLADTDQGDADLPLLTWSADTAEKVFARLRDGFEAVRARCGAPKPLFAAELTDMRPPPPGQLWKVPFIRNGENLTAEAQIVVLALGFGRENSRPDYQTYWQNSPLDSNQGKKLRWLVSGFGDGALTDLMRLCVQRFRHAEFVEAFAKDGELRNQLKALLVSPPEGKTVRDTFEELRARLRGQLEIDRRPDTEVVLNAPEHYLEGRGSSILNRFIVFQLEQDQAFTRCPGEVQTDPELPHPTNGKYRVRFTRPDHEEEFDRLVIRHGPQPALGAGRLPALYEACEELRNTWKSLHDTGELDRTRVPIFDPSDYRVDRPPRSPAAEPEIPTVKRALRYVVLESSHVREPQPLSEIVHTALNSTTYREDMTVFAGGMSTEEPKFETVQIEEALESSAAYDATIRHLCRADIAVIDVTDFDPGVMLFLGIRSVARRGVTVVTTNARFEAATWTKLPFNLKEMYPLSLADDDASERLGQMLASAYKQYRSSVHYQDLPAYNAVRQTDGNDAAVEPGQGILWLCPFGEEYKKEGLAGYVRGQIGDNFASGSRLERVTDILSPQLMSQRLYGAMRLRRLCIVDWTFWSPNVFFELGVRLAMHRMGPVCVLAARTAQPESTVDDGVTRQRARLKKLFAPVLYERGTQSDLRREVNTRYEAMRRAELPQRGEVSRPAFGAFPYDHTLRRVAEYLPLHDEPGGVDPREFFDRLLDALLGAQGAANTVRPVLFDRASPALGEQVTTTARAIGIAAWYYLKHRHPPADARRDPNLRTHYEHVGNRIVPLLESSEAPEDHRLKEEIDEVLDALRPEVSKEPIA
jgi:hypothetical protein